MMLKRISSIAVISIAILFSSCKKFIEVDSPKSQIVSATVYTTDASAISAISGIYSEMVNSGGFASGGPSGISLLAGLSADEFIETANSSERVAFEQNSLQPSNSIVKSGLWEEGYKYIYYANSILKGIEGSTGVSEPVKNQLTGEALFIRAFCHFYLVNLFGNTPYVSGTDYLVNDTASRLPVDQVYQKIIADLAQAQSLLSDDYAFSNGEKVRPNKWAATALLARVYLYSGDWVDADAQATAVINRSDLFTLADLNGVFLKNSSEAIWQLMPVVSGNNTNEGQTFILTSAFSWVALRSELLQAFESGDHRKASWIDSTTIDGQVYYFPFKYKIKATGEDLTEYSMVLRLAEQYLIRAEAKVEQDRFMDAQLDLNTIRNRAGLDDVNASDKISLLLAIEQERRVELFSEWGHRWLDLIRLKRADAVLGGLKSPDWQSNDIRYPIPQSELANDSHLTQNPGY